MLFENSLLINAEAIYVNDIYCFSNSCSKIS